MKARLVGNSGFERVSGFLKGTFSSPTHWPDWNLIVSRHFNTRFRYLVVEEDGALRGVCPVHEVREGFKVSFRSGQFHFIPYGGWITDLASSSRKIRFDLPLNGRFECFSLPLTGSFGEPGQESGHVFHTLVTDLGRDEDEIWSSCIDAKRRNMIRKATRSGVTVASGGDVFWDFFRLYSSSAGNNGLEHLSEAFLDEMMALEGDVRFVPFVAYCTGSPCGALGLVYDKDYAIYWLGATAKDSSGQGQGELLQWEAIRFSRKNGCRLYDLCYIDRERLPQIYGFKKGFSNREVTVSYLNRKRFLYKLLNKLKA